MLLAAAPGSFVGMERKWVAAMRAVLNAAAAAEPGFGHACAALGAISARATTMAAAVNARVLSYDEAEAIQVRQTVVCVSWSAEWWTAWHLSKANMDKGRRQQLHRFTAKGTKATSLQVQSFRLEYSPNL